MRGLESRWSASLVATLVTAIGLVCVVNGARRVGHPFPGFLIAKNHIVVSIGRPGWSMHKSARILFAKIVAVDGHPISDAREVQTLISHLAIGTPVAYRFRNHAEVFTERFDVSRFDLSDYLALYVTYFLVGLCFAIAGWSTLWRRKRPRAAPAFFVLCQLIAIVLVTGGDVYGPYWFTPLYFTAHCLVPAAILHFASDYPEPLAPTSLGRRIALLILYAGSLAIAVMLNLVANDPSRFLPLVYTVYLLLANALLIYLGRLVISWWTASDPILLKSLRSALAAILLSGSIAGVIFVIYPALHQPVSPVLLVAPLGIFPVLMVRALSFTPEVGASTPSAQLRLSLLFLGAVETAFLVGVGVFWLSNSWKQLLDDLALNRAQQSHVEQFLAANERSAPRDLAAIDRLVQTVPERLLVVSAKKALAHQSLPAAQTFIERLSSHYRQIAVRLKRRRQRLSRLDAALILGLVVIGILQAVAFTIAVRRWLIRPIDRLASATSVLATGDLDHRIELDSVREFATLARAINGMAASLADIQRRIERESESREQAAGAARDAERHRLARELHDTVLQDLSAVKLRLESTLKTNPSANLRSAIEGLISVIAGLRSVVDDLRPPDLRQVSLSEAISAHARVLTHAHGIRLDLDLSNEVDVAEWAARDVYRIAQEAIANAVRYGAPTTLWIHLGQTPQGTILEVRDDGAGFDSGTVALGSGILGMRERAAALGGRLDLISAPGRGTVVRLVVPPAGSRHSQENLRRD